MISAPLLKRAVETLLAGWQDFEVRVAPLSDRGYFVGTIEDSLGNHFSFDCQEGVDTNAPYRINTYTRDGSIWSDLCLEALFYGMVVTLQQKLDSGDWK